MLPGSDLSEGPSRAVVAGRPMSGSRLGCISFEGLRPFAGPAGARRARVPIPGGRHDPLIVSKPRRLPTARSAWSTDVP